MEEMIQQLIGCSWGRAVATDDDPGPCPEQAASITVVHDGPREIELRLCPKHKSRIMEETTERTEDAIAVVFMACTECGNAIACRAGQEPPSSCSQHS